MLKRVYSLLLILCLCLTILPLTVTAESAAYTDIVGHPAAAAIEKWSALGIIQGYKGKFEPDNTITRGEMAVILDRLMKYHDIASNTFSDLDDNFYTVALLKANKAGVILGDGNKLRPNGKITNEEVIVMLARALSIPAAPSDAYVFADNDKISDWALPYAASFKLRGYVYALYDKLNPKAYITRAEFVLMLDNIIGAIYNYRGTYTEKIDGIAIINSDNVVLKNCTINGNLIISPSVKQSTIDYMTSSFNSVIGSVMIKLSALKWSEEDDRLVLAMSDMIPDHSYRYVIYRTSAVGIKSIVYDEVFDNASPSPVLDMSKFLLKSASGDKLTAVRYDLYAKTVTEESLPVRIKTTEGGLSNIAVKLADNSGIYRTNTIDITYNDNSDFALGSYYLSDLNDGDFGEPIFHPNGHKLSFEVKDNILKYVNQLYMLKYTKNCTISSTGADVELVSSRAALSPDMVTITPRFFELTTSFVTRDDALYLRINNLEAGNSYNITINTAANIGDTQQKTFEVFAENSAVKSFTATGSTQEVNLTDTLCKFSTDQQIFVIVNDKSDYYCISDISSSLTLDITNDSISVKGAKIVYDTASATADVTFTLNDAIQANEYYCFASSAIRGATTGTYTINRVDKQLTFTVAGDWYAMTAAKLCSVSNLSLSGQKLSFTLKSSQDVAVRK